MPRVVRFSKNDPWEIRTIESWEDYDNIVKNLPRNQWVYRGHGDSKWRPQTALFRAFDDALPIVVSGTNTERKFARRKHERFLLERFKRTAHLYTQPLPKSTQDMEWLSIMQHYGAPTRLLDVTLSPHIAAYFAMESGYGDSAVFAFDHTVLKPKDRTLGQLRKALLQEHPKEQPPYVVLFIPSMTNERLLAQQGAFLVPSHIARSFKSILATHENPKGACIKIVIPAKLRLAGIERLREMNLTSAALFPGIDGFCRSMRFQIFERTQMQGLLA